jgi:hypothetical protein
VSILGERVCELAALWRLGPAQGVSDRAAFAPTGSSADTAADVLGKAQVFARPASFRRPGVKLVAGQKIAGVDGRMKLAPLCS